MIYNRKKHGSYDAYYGQAMKQLDETKRTPVDVSGYPAVIANEKKTRHFFWGKAALGAILGALVGGILAFFGVMPLALCITAGIGCGVAGGLAATAISYRNRSKMLRNRSAVKEGFRVKSLEEDIEQYKQKIKTHPQSAQWLRERIERKIKDYENHSIKNFNKAQTRLQQLYGKLDPEQSHFAGVRKSIYQRSAYLNNTRLESNDRVEAEKLLILSNSALSSLKNADEMRCSVGLEQNPEAVEVLKQNQQNQIKTANGSVDKSRVINKKHIPLDKFDVHTQQVVNNRVAKDINKSTCTAKDIEAYYHTLKQNGGDINDIITHYQDYNISKDKANILMEQILLRHNDELNPESKKVIYTNYKDDTSGFFNDFVSKLEKNKQQIGKEKFQAIQNVINGKFDAEADEFEDGDESEYNFA